ncbi:MAG: PQQ-dependent sugar dehydrogenase [Candidatus Nitrosocosmicus sp.]|nr:PQQ-dependent sugar dehydrogenase [Candidatus Nitrosocosmicus sp.]
MHKTKLLFSFFISSVILLSLAIIPYSVHLSFGAYAKAPVAPRGPSIKDDNLVVEKITDGLDFPTSMAFLGPNDILVTEKVTGKVMRVLDGQIQNEPVLDVPVANSIERGLLGIAVSKQVDGKTYVFLSYTESGDGVDGSDFTDQTDPLGNRLYRYEFVDGRLINPVLLLDLTAIPDNGRGEHNGGKILIGPDNNIYYVIGEVGGHRTQAQNIVDGPAPNGLGGILRITQDGNVVDDGSIFGKGLPLNVYYAMGIRNSFGMDFDPLTGNLWDTENGPTAGDEINLVFPGFNSGWSLIQGFSKNDFLGTGATSDDLVYFGKGSYAEPKFDWVNPIGITALKFLNSAKLGQEYKNNMFVGDINNGLLYRFILNQARDGILINDTSLGNIKSLADYEVNDPKENQPVVFGQGFGGITDIQVGPDGYLYVLSYTGSLFRILPSSDDLAGEERQLADTIVTNDTENDNSATVSIVGINGDKSYSPNPVKIQKGQTVTWYNGDAISHTVTSGLDGDTDAGKIFDSDAIIPNQHYSITFDNTGDYQYYCIYHPSMVGEIIVE